MTTDLQRIIHALEYQYEDTHAYEEHQKNMELAAHIRELEVQLKINSTVAAQLDDKAHRDFIMVGRDWYKRFSEFHDSCQFAELTWEEKTVRVQGYEHGWNDAQRFLKESYVGKSKPVSPNGETFSSLDF